MGGLLSHLRPGRSGGIDTGDGNAPGPSGSAPGLLNEPAPSAWKERRRRRRERRRDANELASQSHVKGDTAHWAKTAARHAREAVRTELRGRMRLPWGGDDAATTAGDAHEDDGASSNGTVDDKHLRVVLDLGMQDLMCDAEIKSTVTQLQCSYASVLNLAVDAVIARNANRHEPDTPPQSDMLCTALERKRRAARRMIEAAGPECEPPRLLFASLHGRIETALAKDGGSARWPVTTSPQPFADAAKAASNESMNPIRNIVVMSPDARIALTEAPSPRDVYVIGGLCDYKRITNATLDRAEAFKVTARRLPIEETLGTNLNVNILTVNQTAECLFRARLNHGDWAAALQDVLPKRKLEEVDETRRKREAARS